MPAHSSTWISNGFEQLLYRSRDQEAVRFDIVIVGSGYGAAMAAAELAGCRERGESLTVCVLERGNEYLPGSFPSRMADLPRHVRASVGRCEAPLGQRDGLFDFRLGPDISALVANGLGGGSLINAGVMVAPKAAVFDRGWPGALKNDSGLMDYYDRAKRLLGAADTGGDNTIERHCRHRESPLPKHGALKRLAGDGKGFHPTPITVAMEAKHNSGGVQLDPCQLCGDCATGCNHNAKDSLDTNLLVVAKRRGAEIFTGATVLRIEREADEWVVHTVPTGAKLRKCQAQPLPVRAGRVVLAAGAFGSTEILMRSASPSLRFSERLGHGFSGNGDMVAAGYRHSTEINAVASEHCDPGERGVGPTITGMIDCVEEGLLVQELAVPGPIRRGFEELVTTANSLRELMRTDSGVHHYGHPDPDPYAVDEQAITRTGVYAVMGDDGAEGALELIEEGEGDGAIRMHWPGVGRLPLFDEQTDLLQRRARASGLDGTILPNPMWRLLPKSMASLLGDQVGPPLTVHPLGGCCMGDDHNSGVVDHLGRVFNAGATHAGDRLHPGLVVLDGSVMATALGVNPALSIAALALRAVETLRDDIWQLQPPGEEDHPPRQDTRPRVVESPADIALAEPYRETLIRLTERVVGRATLTGADGRRLPCVIDITLSFDPKSLRQLTRGPDRTLTVDGEASSEPASAVRVFRRNDWERLKRQRADEIVFDRAALLVAPVSGTLTLLRRAATDARRRRWRTIWAWLWNRGLRDAWQAAVGYLTVGRHLQTGGLRLLSRAKEKLREVRALSSHAGEVRLFEYELTIDEPAGGWPENLAGFSGSAAIKAAKHITYGRRSNPLRQLEEMWLLEFPGLQRRQPKRPFLRYDSTFLAHRDQPLIRIVAQQDQPTALADTGAFLAYFARLLIGVHAWSFRKPDTPPLRQPHRLPGKIAGLPRPQITEIDLGRTGDDQPVRIRLTRYPRAGSRQPPVLLIHGYSASGNTFTHPAIKPNMAGYFWRRQRDVWVLDLRTSSGMATASLPWSFEDVAHADIPVAVDHVFRATGQKCDLVAHCMGAAIFSMAVLSPPRCGDRHYRERRELPLRINKAVLSQVGPRVVFTPANIFRAYLLNYVRHLLPDVFYSFRAAADESLPMRLLDRLLAALPYPKEEFDRENPRRFWKRRPFVGTRHRIDGLYGRAFSLKNLPDGLLRYIDDLFGPLNLGTLGQVIHFSRWEQITNRAGRNDFVTRENLKKRWIFPTLSVHGDENGLADIATLTRMGETFAGAGVPLQTAVFRGFGHQDSLIGKGAEKNYARIQAFFEAPPEIPVQPGEYEPAMAGRLLVELPYSGPVIGERFEREGGEYISVGLGTSPERGRPELILFLAVTDSGDKLSPAIAGDAAGANPLASAICLKLATGAVDDWYKVALPVPDSPADTACGYLACFVYDRGIELGELTYGHDLPDNLLGLLDAAQEAAYLDSTRGFTPHKQRLKSYLEQLLDGDLLTDAVARCLEQPAPQLRAGLVEIPPPVRAGDICFVFGSCQYPAGMMDAEDAFASYRRLSQRLDRSSAEPRPGFALLMGDQIYADPTAGLFDPTHKDDRYIGNYHKWLHNHHVKMVLRRLPSCMMLDDHEIQNDWDRGEASAQPGFLADGRAAYLNFQRHLHQPAKAAAGGASHPLWYEFSHGGIAFFMADTRSERQRRNAANLDGARIFSEAQYEDLQRWLLQRQAEAPLAPKFIVTPSMLLPRRLYTAGANAHALRSDAWDGYPFSLHRLLGFILEREITNLVFLSGDEHLSGVADITLSDPRSARRVNLHSVHSSGFYVPLPFVNTRPADLAGQESFHFAVPGQGGDEYHCRVDTCFVPGSGYAVMRVFEQDDHWRLCCEFDRAAGTQTFDITLKNKRSVAESSTKLALGT